MNDLIQQLVELTAVDHDLVQTRGQIAGYPAMLTQMQASEAAERHQIEELDKELETARHARRQAEKEVTALREKVQKYFVQQAAVKTNKEYEAMTHEIDQARARVDEFETQGLDALEREERSETQRKQARARLETLARVNGEERQRIETQTVEKRERQTRLETERARRLAALPEQWRDQYELLNQHFPGTACAPLESESCTGCHWHLVAHTCQVVRMGQEIIECDHCRRILYAPGASSPGVPR